MFCLLFSHSVDFVTDILVQRVGFISKVQDIQKDVIYMFLGAFTKLWKATISFVMSVLPSLCPHETTRLPLDGFS
jgi:hypothetical protein